MNINEDQLKLALRIAGCLTNEPETATPTQKGFIGRHVVVRSNRGGVWMGRLVSQSRNPDSPEGCDVVLQGARQAWYWEGANNCVDLAEHGPTGGKITAPVDVEVYGCNTVIPATDASVMRWKALPVWTRS
jgi:hypothetical protein